MLRDCRPADCALVISRDGQTDDRDRRRWPITRRSSGRRGSSTCVRPPAGSCRRAADGRGGTHL